MQTVGSSSPLLVEASAQPADSVYGDRDNFYFQKPTIKAKRFTFISIILASFVAVFSRHRFSTSTSLANYDHVTTAPWGLSSLINNEEELLATKELKLFSEAEDGRKGTLNELLYLNDTHAFDQLRIGGKGSSVIDFYYYQQGWEAQITQSYCAVASSTSVLNSLKGKITLPQDQTYTPYPWATQTQLMLNKCVKETLYDIDKMKHMFFGLGLDMAKQLLDCHLKDQNYTVEAHHVDPNTTTVEEVREAIKDALTDTEARVLINYDRGGIGQGNMGHGHFSPLGAYHYGMDAFLVMDVAKYKYPPVWVPSTNLMGGLASLDRCGNFRYPDAPPDMSKSWEEIAKELGCKPAYRGFIIVKSAF